MQNRLPFRLFAVALSLFLTAMPVHSEMTAKLSAEDAAKAIAPFVNDETVLVAHFDLRQLDLDDLAKRSVGLIDSLLKSGQFDNDSHQAILRELNRYIEKKLPILKEPLEKITKEIGVRDCYLVSQPDLEFDYQDSSVKIECYAVIPLAKNKQQSFRGCWNDFLTWLGMSEDVNCILEKDDCIIFILDSHVETLFTDFSNYLQSFEAKPVPKLAEVWKQHEHQFCKATLLLTPPIREMLLEHFSAEKTSLKESHAATFDAFLKAVVPSLQAVSFGFDLPNWKSDVVLQFVTDSEAKQARKAMEAFIESVIQNVKNEYDDESTKTLMNVYFEYARACAIRQLPKVEENRLKMTVGYEDDTMLRIATSILFFMIDAG